MSFFIAMQNRRAMATYSHPQTIISEGYEFIVVSRSGGPNDHLSISNAGASTGLESEAPSDLRPDFEILATLVSQGPDGGEIFLVEREVPPGGNAGKGFVGGDGYVVLRQGGEGISITGAVRLRPGPETEVARTRCFLLADGEAGATLHFEARYIPWSREVLPSGPNGAPPPSTSRPT